MISPNVEEVVRHIPELAQLENALSVLDAFLGLDHKPIFFGHQP